MRMLSPRSFFFFFNDTATTEIYTLSLHDALPISRMLHLSQREAEGFYAVHRERPFFKDLVRYMTSGPIIVQVLEGERAVARNRDIMGATDPKKEIGRAHA